MPKQLTRRGFLGKTARLGAALGLAPLVSACDDGAKRGDFAADMEDHALRRRIGDRYSAILDMAGLAPSSHNTQPWTIRIDGPGRWTLGLAPDRLLPAVDPDRREAILSLGAFVENLHRAAAHHKYDVDVNVTSDDPNSTEIARIHLTGGAAETTDITPILQRRTRRDGLSPAPLNRTDIAALRAGDDGDGVGFVDVESPQGKRLAEATVEANKLQVARDAAQGELADWFRWSDADAGKHRNGLSPEAMEITGITGWYVRNNYDRATVLEPEFRERMAGMVEEQVQLCGGWLIVTSEGTGVTDLIEAGRRYERVALNAVGARIGVHPMSQVLEEEPLRDTIASDIGLDKPVQFVLRVGRIEEIVPPTSLRMPLSRWVTV